MDKKVVLAVAGAGKTRLIVDELNLIDRTLIITYTENNLETLKRRICEKFGHIPENIKVFSYFTFLYSFSYKPFLSLKVRAAGINWELPPIWTRTKKRTDPLFYMDTFRRLYHNRIAKLLEQQGTVDDVIDRLQKYFDRMFIDEVQDMAGHDFDFLAAICRANIGIVMVGDFFQHTFDTSRDGNVNGNLYQDYGAYIARLERIGLQVDTKTLSQSHRCSPTVCDFISNNLGIKITSHRGDVTAVELVDRKEQAERIFCDNSVVKLFYSEHYKYPCFSQNWGASKGQDHYKDVCVILSKKNFSLLQETNLVSLNAYTKNKLYVACSRSSGNLSVVLDEHVKAYRRDDRI